MLSDSGEVIRVSIKPISEVPLEKAMAPHSSTLAWKIPWTEEPGGLQSMGSLRVWHNWATSLSLFTFMHWKRKWQPTPVFLPGESRDGGAWWAAIYGVAQSRTQLKWLSRDVLIRRKCCVKTQMHIKNAMWSQRQKLEMQLQAKTHQRLTAITKSHRRQRGTLPSRFQRSTALLPPWAGLSVSRNVSQYIFLLFFVF